jgi:hypothetical protein
MNGAATAMGDSMIMLRWIWMLVRKTMRGSTGRYRPEKHYMRGFGPASERAKSRSAR